MRFKTGVNDFINVIKKGIHGWTGHIARVKYNIWTIRVTEWTPCMDKMAGKTNNKTERQPYPPPGSCVAKNSYYRDRRLWRQYSEGFLAE